MSTPLPIRQLTPKDFGGILARSDFAYLNRITRDDSKRWTYGPVDFRLRQRDFQVKVRGGRWNAQIGATSQALVLIASRKEFLKRRLELNHKLYAEEEAKGLHKKKPGNSKGTVVEGQQEFGIT